MQDVSKNARKPYIEGDNLSFAYPRGKSVFSDLSIALYSGEFTAIIGANGCGKTTLGKLLTGILQPKQGRVLISGEDASSLSLGEIGQRIGYLFQEPDRQLFASTVEEEVGFPLLLKGQAVEKVQEQVEEVLELFELGHRKEAFTLHLSRGEKQRLALASILVHQPAFLILDEPTTGLDNLRCAILTDILHKLKSTGIGILAISHDEEFVAQNADRVLTLKGGVISESESDAL